MYWRDNDTGNGTKIIVARRIHNGQALAVDVASVLQHPPPVAGFGAAKLPTPTKYCGLGRSPTTLPQPYLVGWLRHLTRT
jgi:hypothetical protein